MTTAEYATLRDLVMDHARRRGWRTQRRVAVTCGLDETALSRFLDGRQDLGATATFELFKSLGVPVQQYPLAFALLQRAQEQARALRAGRAPVRAATRPTPPPPPPRLSATRPTSMAPARLSCPECSFAGLGPEMQYCPMCGTRLAVEPMAAPAAAAPSYDGPATLAICRRCTEGVPLTAVWCPWCDALLRHRPESPLPELAGGRGWTPKLYEVVRFYGLADLTIVPAERIAAVIAAERLSGAEIALLLDCGGA